MDLVVDTIQKLRSEACIAGFHFCTLNLEKSVQRVLDSLGWTGGVSTTSPASNKLITVRIIPFETSHSDSRQGSAWYTDASLTRG